MKKKSKPKPKDFDEAFDAGKISIVACSLPAAKSKEGAHLYNANQVSSLLRFHTSQPTFNPTFQKL